MQEKKKAEADKQKELNDLFAIAIKQPKVPPGEVVALVVGCLALSASLLLAKPYQSAIPGSANFGGTMFHILKQAASMFLCLAQPGSEPRAFRHWLANV